MRFVSNQSSSGFTLVEMMVSIAIFMVVAVVAVAALLKIVDANRKSQTLQDALNNLNFAMDSITREIRVGNTYDCVIGGYFGRDQVVASQCPSGASNNWLSGSGIAFLSSNIGTIYHTPYITCNLTYSYYFAPHPDGEYDHWTIEKAQQNYCNDIIDDPSSPPTSGDVVYSPIIDPDIVITAYNINVVEGAETQPSVFLYISGYTGSDVNTRTYFDLQTTISQRNRG